MVQNNVSSYNQVLKIAKFALEFPNYFLQHCTNSSQMTPGLNMSLGCQCGRPITVNLSKITLHSAVINLVRSRKPSKPRDLMLNSWYRFEIQQAARQSLWSLKTTRCDVKFIKSLLNLAGVSAAVLPTRLPKFQSDWKALNINREASRLHEIWWYRSVKIGPGATRSNH